MNSPLTLADTLLRNAIGYDRLHRFAENASMSGGFPPHNIEKTGDDRYRLTLAVAGYSKDEINMELHDGVLNISAERADELADGVTYLHRGIAMRSFRREFRLGEHVEVVGAKLKDGLLVIDLERIVPESQRPKTIPIK